MNDQPLAPVPTPPTMPPTFPPAAPMPVMPQSASPRKWIIIAIAIVVVLALAAGAWYLSDQKRRQAAAVPTPTPVISDQDIAAILAEAESSLGDLDANLTGLESTLNDRQGEVRE